ncbi:quinone-dependent dihydroorotate dehydrogenase [bacterium]|nr:quinone-dependent dihydroorotate dehydrogenase [candidate division CSSED10-310 bacterium]
MYERLLRPLLFLQDAEHAHERALRGLSLASPLMASAGGLIGYSSPTLETTVLGVRFPNPVGLAAGFDKDARALTAWQHLGFGFIELGTVTARAQAGNTRPRLFRMVGEEAVINHMGFNNRGAAAMAERLRRYRERGRWPLVPVGINIGKSYVVAVADAVPDYLAALDRIVPFADFVTLNVSSPNTPGLRALQEMAALRELAGAVRRTMADCGTPLLLKIAPDADEQLMDDIAAVIQAESIDGLIVTNTTVRRDMLRFDPGLEGGLSGRPLAHLAMAVLRGMRRRLGSKVPLIAVGGIGDGEEAYARIKAGASLVQIYTAFIYKGPLLVRRVLKDLDELLRRDGFSHVSQAVGADAV